MIDHRAGRGTQAPVGRCSPWASRRAWVAGPAQFHLGGRVQVLVPSPIRSQIPQSAFFSEVPNLASGTPGKIFDFFLIYLQRHLEPRRMAQS